MCSVSEWLAESRVLFTASFRALVLHKFVIVYLCTFAAMTPLCRT